MTEFPREFCKADAHFSRLLEIIKGIHKVAPHTEKVLRQNSHIENFVSEATHFCVLPGKPPLYIHYDVSSQLRGSNEVVVVIDCIAVYDDFLEYETARLRGIHSTTESVGGNLN